MRGIVVKWFLIVVIAFCGQDAISQELDSEREGSSLFLQRPSLQLRAGFTGSYWNPKGIDPYQLDTYGRTYAYLDVAAMHPLLFLGEGFDLISIPRIGVETNLGYTTEGSSLYEALPAYVTESPYLKTTAWATLLKFISFRWRNESFRATMTDASGLFGDYITSDGVLEVNCSQRDLEIGLIGSTDGEIHPTMVEIGLFFSDWERPIAFYTGGLDAKPSLLATKLHFEGYYAGLTSEPIQDVWPFQSYFGMRAGSGQYESARSIHLSETLDDEDYVKLFGFDVRLKHERKVTKKFRAGFMLEAEYRIARGSHLPDNSSYKILTEPSETRYRFSLLARYDLF